MFMFRRPVEVEWSEVGVVDETALFLIPGCFAENREADALWVFIVDFDLLQCNIIRNSKTQKTDILLFFITKNVKIVIFIFQL